MRKREDLPPDPEVTIVLDAIDSALAGEAVDPRRAEWAELSVLLAAERPTLSVASAAELDDRVERGFAPAASERWRPRLRRWVWAPAGGLAAVLIVAVVIVAGQGGSGSSASTNNNTNAVPLTPSISASAAQKAPVTHQRGSIPASSTAASSAQSAHPLPEAQSLDFRSASGYLQPPTAGRKVVQGAQLSLSTAPRRVDQVAQELFNVVGQQRGIVNSSTVTATGGPNGYAQFRLSVPSPNLSQVMAALSTLPFAHVVSRTDSTQDVTGSYDADQRRLANARALKTSLLKQLANAVTQAQIDSLTGRIHDADAAISADEATLNSLQHQVGYSQVFVTINAGSVPVPVHRGSGGFTLGRAAHDAGHVLTIAAGVALIGLAALVPVALLLALGWWVSRVLRRRSRLQALDLH